MNTTTARFEALHVRWFAAAVLLAAVAVPNAAGGGPVLVIAMLAVAIAIWHGAFDHVLAQEALEPHLGQRWALVFFPAYLALAALCLVAWWAVPAVALPVFLLYSALHFGTEEERNPGPLTLVTGLAAGCVPIAAACHWWPQPVMEIFAEMLRFDGRFSPALAHGLGLLLWPAVAGAAAAALPAQRGRSAWVLGALLAQLLLFRVCPPLPAFAVYFCLWHTPQHLVATSVGRGGTIEVRRMVRHLAAGAGPWLLAVLAIAAGCWFGRHAAAAYAGTLFIGLSALTVPHMVLAEVCRRLETVSQATRLARVQGATA